MMTFANQKCINNPSYNNFEEIDLLLKFIHWQKVSHGLFDYEMKQIIKQNFKLNTSKKIIRKDTEIKIVDQNVDVRQTYGAQAQELMYIDKLRNKYFLRGVKPDDPNVDVDDLYFETGEPQLPPIDMKDRMYNVVRFLKEGENMKKQEYILKKNDIIKLGRIKLKVHRVFIQKKDQLF